MLKQNITNTRYNPNMVPSRIKSMLDIALRCKLSYRQEALLLNYQEQFLFKGTLTEKQVAVLEDIYERAAATND